MPSAAEVSVVIASHARPSRLRWLLNALEAQTFAGEWDAVVVHDYDADTARRVIETHPLARAGRLHAVAIDPGSGSPARQRNLGWQQATGELIAFTDDDCRPETRWLDRLVATARHAPEAVVQGATRPEPFEAAIHSAPHVRTLYIEPVGPYGQTCNMLYPRELLDRLGGFDERAITGEDVALMLSARADGRRVVAAADAVVYHAVEAHSLPGILRQNWKWRHLALLVKAHPEIRRQLPVGVFWDRDHLYTSAALIGLVGSSKWRPLGLLAAPYLAKALGRRGPGTAARALAAAEIPGQAVRQVAEVAGLVAGSVRHRTPLL